MPYIPLPNASAGTAPGRVATPVLINTAVMAGGTTASMTTIAAETYKEIRIICRTSGGMVTGSPAFIRFNGDTGANYDSLSLYNGGTNAPIGATSGQLALTASVATVPTLTMIITLLPLVASSLPRAYACTFWSQGSAGGTFIKGTTDGYWNNAASGLTDVQITFGTAATGSVEFWGVPA
jgi:hypothetical protein